MPKEKIKNELETARRSLGLTRKQVAALLGYPTASAIEKYERGVSMPPLKTALALEVILRRPLAFLWTTLYRDLRERIRAQEGSEHA